MLRVGLTGGLGSGKSTVAAMLRSLGAEVTESDALGREMMQPGHAVYHEIVRHFGPEIVNPDGQLNRARLADLAFRQGKLHELNAIVHPPVIAAQKRWMEDVSTRDPNAIAVVESALIFEVVRDALARGETNHPLAGASSDRSSSPGLLADWRKRIDRVIVVAAPDRLKVARYAARINPSGTNRAAIEADAMQRLSYQVPDAEKAAQADYVLDNSGDIDALRTQVLALWPRLQAESNKIR
jgi:dephospho-CoA kinase